MGIAELYVYYFFNPWINESALDILGVVTSLGYILVLIIVGYFMVIKRKYNEKLLLLLFLPSSAVYFCVSFYWYTLILALTFIYISYYSEVKKNKLVKEQWDKSIKLSISLTVALPVITIIICEFLGFGYKLFP